MPEKIVQLNEEIIKGQLKELVRGSVEETLNELLEKVPTWTQAELQALSDQQLNEELYFIIDLSDSGWDSNTLSKYSREVISTIVAQHPQFAYGSFRSGEKHLEFYRSDIAEEKKRRQDIKEEEKDQQGAQDAANAPEVQKLLEQAIASGTCETYQITLTGYTDGAIQLACKNMKTPGYTFSGYTYAASSTTSDYNVTAKTGGHCCHHQLQVGPE